MTSNDVALGRQGRREQFPPALPLRHVRQLLGLTLEQVAHRIAKEVPELTVSRGTLSAIENGSRGVSDLMLVALARAYRLPDDAFVINYEPRERRPRNRELAS